MRHLKASSLLLATGLVFALARVAAAQMGGAPTVRVDLAEQRMLSATTLVPGTVVSRHDADVAAEVEGRLLEVLDVGTSIRRGEVLARIDDRGLKLRNQELQAEIARAEARLEYLDSDEKRYSRLAEQNLAAAAQLDLTRADLAVAAGDLAVARARLAQNEHDLDRTLVRAPFDGSVVERRMMAGERAAEGSVIARIVDLQSLEVIARAPLDAYGHVRAGETLRLRAPAFEAAGRVRTVVEVGDEDTHQFELRLDMDAGVFPVGQTLRVQLPVSASREALVVHRDALVLRPEGVSVFVVNADDTVRQVSVTTGVGDGDRIEVSGALEAGERVVVRGNERLQPGQAVSVSK